MFSGRRDDDRARAYHDDRSRYSQQHGQQPPRRKRSRSPDGSVWGRDRRQWGRTSRSDDGCSGDSVWDSRSRSYGGRDASLPYASQAVQHRSRPVGGQRRLSPSGHPGGVLSATLAEIGWRVHCTNMRTGCALSSVHTRPRARETEQMRERYGVICAMWTPEMDSHTLRMCVDSERQKNSFGLCVVRSGRWDVCRELVNPNRKPGQKTNATGPRL